jgi:hypothetical protein
VTTYIPTGVVCIAPGLKTTVAYAPNDMAAVRSLKFEEPARLDLNDYLVALAKCAASHIDHVRYIVMHESDPASREEAERHNFIKRAALMIARTRGIGLIATHEVHLEALHDPKPLFINSPVDYALGPVNALRLEVFRRTAIEKGVPFGNTLIRFDARKHRSTRRFHELLGGAAIGRFEWHGYNEARASTKAAPMWTKAEGIA